MVCCVVEALFYLKIAESWVFKQSLQIYVLQIMQNDTSHLNIWQLQKKCFESFFCFVLLTKRWHYLKITKGWHFRYMLHMGVLQITQIRQVTIYQLWIVVNNILNWFFFVLWCKMDGLMLRLLIVFFLDMFCKLVFCKLENMRWPSNIPEISNRSVWSKWLKPPYI